MIKKMPWSKAFVPVFFHSHFGWTNHYMYKGDLLVYCQAMKNEILLSIFFSNMMAFAAATERPILKSKQCLVC